MATKFEVEGLNGKGDYLLWKKKIRVVLVQQKVAKAIDKTYTARTTEEKKAEIDEIALSSIIFHLSDLMLRKVDTIKTTSEMWEKLDEFY